MRERLVIWILLPCLTLAWPSLPLTHAQEPPPGAAAAEKAAVDEAPAAEVGEEAAAPAPAAIEIDKWNDAHSVLRFKRPFIYWPKLLALWALFVVWVRSADWVNRDTQIFNLGYGKWNLILFFPFVLLLLFLVFIIGHFWIALGALAVCYLATFVPFVVTRNKVVELHEKVFTPDWLRYEFAQLAGKVGLKIEAERKPEYAKGAPVDLMAIGAPDERDNQANLISARQSPGYLLVKELIADMV
ncbi:MAG: hypothetical protein WD229_16265, partial [Pirellulales bacterium]